jgi:hypothetical protein
VDCTGKGDISAKSNLRREMSDMDDGVAESIETSPLLSELRRRPPHFWHHRREDQRATPKGPLQLR